MKDYLEINNGDIFESKNYGKFEIISKLNYIFDENGLQKSDSRHPYYIVKFIDTNYITNASRASIIDGTVKDKFKPNVYNIGYLGESNFSDPNHRLIYITWARMLSRCYNPLDEKFKSYGNIGVKVDERWHNFTNFYNDILHLTNFQYKILYPQKFQLDKDLLQLNIPKNQRIYSKDTCIFLSQFDNTQILTREKSIRNKKYFGVIENFNSKNSNIINSYSTIVPILINGYYKRKAICSFTNKLAAANLFNYVYPFATLNSEFHMVNILNKLDKSEIIPYNDLKKYISYNTNNWFNDYPDGTYIASAMEAAGDRFTYIYL